MTSWFAYEGRLSRVLLAVFWWFATSVQALLTAVPFAAADRLGLTHAGIWLGAITAIPIGPGLYALLKCTRDHAIESGYPGAPLRRFWSAWSEGWNRLWRIWTGAAFIGLLLAYNAALYGESDTAFAAIALAALLAAAALIATACASLAGAAGPALSVLTAALRAATARPQAPTAWLALLAFAYGAANLPVIGSNLTLFLPAAFAWSVLIVNTATGFDRSVRR